MRVTDAHLSYQDLVEEILDELLLKRARGEEAVQISTQELGNCDIVKMRSIAWERDSNIPTYMSSRGEMKISLRLMTCCMFSGIFQGEQEMA